MEKIEEDAIKSTIAIIIGLCVLIFFKQFLGGIILIAVGIVIAAVNESLRNPILSFIKLLWDKITKKVHHQEIKDTVGGLHQQSSGGRDSMNAGGSIYKDVTFNIDGRNNEMKENTTKGPFVKVHLGATSSITNNSSSIKVMYWSLNLKNLDKDYDHQIGHIKIIYGTKEIPVELVRERYHGNRKSLPNDPINITRGGTKTIFMYVTVPTTEEDNSKTLEDIKNCGNDSKPFKVEVYSPSKKLLN